MNSQFGGVNVVYRVSPQHGYGLGGYFRKFMKWLVPITEKHVIPHISRGLKTIGDEAVESAYKIAKDTIKGKNFKEVAEVHGNLALENLKRKAEAELNSRGAGIKKKII